MIALLSANVLYYTLVALLVLRLLNGCLRWAALQYPNSEVIQRLNAWANVRRPWDALTKMLGFQPPPSPPELPYDSVTDIPPLDFPLLRYMASKIMQTEGALLPRLQQDTAIFQGSPKTSIEAQVLLCVRWMQGLVEPFPYLDGHLPQWDLDVILENIPGPKQEAFLQWLEYWASVELGPPSEYPASQV